MNHTKKTEKQYVVGVITALLMSVSYGQEVSQQNVATSTSNLAPQVTQSMTTSAEGNLATTATDSRPSSTPDSSFTSTPLQVEVKADTSVEAAKPEGPPAPSETIQTPSAEVKPEAPSVTPSKGLKDLEQSQEDMIKENILDTVNIDEGFNWLEVRRALEDTIDQIEKINNLFIQILDVRMDYLKRRNAIDKEFDFFANEIGFDLGQLDQILISLLDQMNEERQHTGDLNEQERAFVEKIAAKKKGLEQLQKDVKSIMELDLSVDDIVMMVEEQINRSRGYQNQAWKNFQEIKKLPQKATDLLARTRGLFDNMQEIYVNYLKGKLLAHFNETLSMLSSQMNKVKSQFNELKSSGTDLKKESQKIHEKFHKSAKPEDHKPEEHQAPQTRTWLEWIKQILYYPIEKIQDLWSYLFGKTPVNTPAQAASSDEWKEYESQ